MSDVPSVSTSDTDTRCLPPTDKVPDVNKPDLTLGLPTSLAATVAYLFCSSSLILFNKVVFSAPDFNYPWSILATQSFFVVAIIAFLQNWRQQPIFSPILTRQLLLPSTLFTLYLFTNARALLHMPIPVLSVLKSFAPMGVAVSEKLIFGDKLSRLVLAAMFLILIANAIMLTHRPNTTGPALFWTLSNVVINIAHVLSMRICLTKQFSPIEKAMHANMIATVLMLPIALVSHELLPFLLSFPNTPPHYQIIFALSCVVAAAIGGSIFWLVQQTSGSTLSFVGSCNKFAVVLLGAVFFKSDISKPAWISVFFGLLAGSVFTVAKAYEKAPASFPLLCRNSAPGSSTAHEIERLRQPPEEQSTKGSLEKV